MGCIYSMSGLANKGIDGQASSRRKRGLFGSLFSTVKKVFTPTNVGCALTVGPAVAECVSQNMGNIATIVTCAIGIPNGASCVCSLICSTYQPACNLCMQEVS